MTKNIILSLLFTFFLITEILGCARTRTIVNVEGFIPENINKNQIADSVKDGCENANWYWNVVDLNTIRASYINKRQYQIIVDIDYSRPTKYEIKYIKSDYLQDEGKGEIHKAYFKWVGALKKSIDKSMKKMSRRERYCGKDSNNNLNSLCVLND